MLIMVDNVVDEWSDKDERYWYSNANAIVKCNTHHHHHFCFVGRWQQQQQQPKQQEW